MNTEERGAPIGRRSLRCLGLLLCLTGCQHTPQEVWRLDESSSFGKQYLASLKTTMGEGGGLIAITYIRQAPSDVPGDATIFDCDGDQVHKEKGLAIQRGDTLHVTTVWSDGYYLVRVSR